MVQNDVSTLPSVPGSICLFTSVIASLGCAASFSSRCSASPCSLPPHLQPASVKQGRLGDCWFLASVAGLAERPGGIERAFIAGRRWVGVGRLRLCIGGSECGAELVQLD